MFGYIQARLVALTPLPARADYDRAAALLARRASAEGS
jgi:hypothetical protein